MDDGIIPPTQEQEQEPRAPTGTFRAFIPEQRLFNRYLIRQELGRGGRGVVWLAQDTRLFCFVALKFLADELVREPEALHELRHETLVSRKITHPHIMRIYDFEQDDSAAAISMEYVEGETLSQLRYKRERHCFDAEDIRTWMLQLAEALYYAHSVAGIVHRDLKPSNLMIDADGRLKITDFGIASVIADSMSRVTRTQIVSGTLPYMSPQQALGDLPRESDDIYSFGAVIYELLTSRPPFFRGNVAAQIHTAQVPSINARRQELGREGPPIPQVWEDIVSSCLAKSPADRPASAKVIAQWIEKGARDSAPEAIRAIPQPLPSAIPGSRKNAQMALAAAALFVVGTVIWLVNKPADTHRDHNPVASGVVTANSVPSSTPAVTPPSPVVTPPPSTPAPVAEVAKAEPPKTTPIIVNTMPSGADVFLNGDSKGKSPLQLENVGVGSWRLKVDREGYESAEFIVDVREDGTTQPPLIELVRKPMASTPAPSPTPKPIAGATPAPVPTPPAAPPSDSPNGTAIMSVVNGYTHALETGNANDYVALCAPRVGYFDEGQKTRDYIHRSREMFMTHWSNYEVRNLHGVNIREAPDASSAHVSLAYDWSAISLGAHTSKHHSISAGQKRGTVTDTLDLQKIDGHWLIIKMWQEKMDR